MIAAGVPPEAILIEPDATNTLENITFSARLIERTIGWSQVKSLALCCKPIHSRRAFLTARTHLPPGLSISVHCPNDPMDIQSNTWWQSARGQARVLGEMGRISEYALKGDIRLTDV